MRKEIKLKKKKERTLVESYSVGSYDCCNGTQPSGPTGPCGPFIPGPHGPRRQ